MPPFTRLFAIVLLQNDRLKPSVTGFVIDYLLAKDPDFQAMVSRRGEAAKNLISALKQVLYGGKRSFLVNRSGALRREERDFAESEVGRLARVSFQERELTRKVKLSVRFFQFLFLVEIKRFFFATAVGSPGDEGSRAEEGGGVGAAQDRRVRSLGTRLKVLDREEEGHH